MIALIAVARILFARPRPLRLKTEQLAISVWAAHGPFKTASDAEERLQQACLIVFGPDGLTSHDGWARKHAQNFHLWEQEGRLEQGVEMMRSALLATAHGPHFDSACQELRSELRRSATEAMLRVNKDMESSGRRFDAVEQGDGSLQFFVRDDWTAAERERREQATVEGISDKVGHNLFNDQSEQARQLLAFLSRVQEESAGKAIDGPREAGAAWLTCFAEGGDSQIGQAFKPLNDAWLATRPPPE